MKMCSVKEMKQIPCSSTAKFEFRMKLLAGNNVVLVEANGYDSEIFLPQITNGRIIFQNVIPSRRCYCYESQPQSQTTPKEENYSNAPQRRTTLTKLKSIESSRLSAGHDSYTRLKSPTAFSTPTNFNNNANNANKENNNSIPQPRCANTNRSESMLTLPSPELTNFVPTTSSSLQFLKDKCVMPVPNKMRILKLHREPSPSTSAKVGRVLNTSPLIVCNKRSPARTARIDACSFCLPSTPDMKAKSAQKHNSTQPPGTVTKWRKCLTPVRTYTRRPNSGATIIIAKPNAGTKKSVRVVPTFLVNPTQVPKPQMRVEVRKRKLIVDTKKTISPKSFKKQQQMDCCSRASSSTNTLPSKRALYENAKMDVNTMLRSSNRGSAISAKLSQQFNKACLDRVCATYPKYRLLCTIPPLDNDFNSRGIRAKLKEQEQQTIDSFPSTTPSCSKGLRYDCSQDIQKISGVSIQQ